VPRVAILNMKELKQRLCAVKGLHCLPSTEALLCLSPVQDRIFVAKGSREITTVYAVDAVRDTQDSSPPVHRLYRR